MACFFNLIVVKNKDNTSKRSKKPWPTKDAMQQVYEKNLWGSGESDFYSGEGSHKVEIVAPYVQAIITFLDTFEKPISVCDLGCGDFNVGKELVQYTKNYIAVDIVPELIERNREKFKVSNLEFQSLDIAKDKLPTAECAIIRQVLQHLSNNEVKLVTEKLYDYTYVIVTEHLPKGNFQPNADIISGQGTRLKKQSGIHLLAPPFNLKVKEEKVLLSIPDEHGIIVTTLYRFK
ncbi:class I SAM-dependent methyltransferase [Maribacter hydrothermalis]|uniref:SAM-dependent methyltransferase n=1 Tax=Maribacter hydrothermalis TaxID=1836467 RepID=A0A1B7Z3C9_9FLAO|nr:class I SAM-dependent methyltransferase [Maribacter hydrothermalis]APQ16922.1 SAM-dependent methyltransferase [Maribacter hydrothermalis]OBR37184.1 SAM-dependent methyltransferase [Maribacter hydrothermalis]